MTPEPLLECTFFVPIHRDKELSDGGGHTSVEWTWLMRKLYACFDGWTKGAELHEGQWKSPKTGNPIADQSYQYRVALPEQRLDELRKVLIEACVVFRQQMIYLSVAGWVEFIEGPQDGPTS